jgi:uncharacterized protein (UPF0332 family)
MFEETIKRLEGQGKLKKQKAGFVQVEGLLRTALSDLHEAKATLSVANTATYVMAYMAMLKAGRALLLWKGYVPDGSAQHKTVVEVTGVILGEKYKALIDRFEMMRRKRNELTYDIAKPLSKAESDKAFSDAIELVKNILKEVKTKNPQMELDFDL